MVLGEDESSVTSWRSVTHGEVKENNKTFEAITEGGSERVLTDGMWGGRRVV